MNKNFKLMLFVAVLALAAMACGFQASTANFAEAYMSADADGTV